MLPFSVETTQGTELEAESQAGTLSVLTTIPTGEAFQNLATVSGTLDKDLLVTTGGPAGQLYVTDGTTAGTFLLFTAGPGGEISPLTTQGDRAFFVATSTSVAEASVGGVIESYTAYDSEVYGSDGTTAGTQLLAEVEFGSPLGESGGGISVLTTQGDRTFFVATSTPIAEASVGGVIDTYTAYDLKVYGSDGTTAGTQLLAEVEFGSPLGESGGGISLLTTQGDRTFFVATSTPIAEASVGGAIDTYTAYDSKVYGSDGTTAGTQLLAEVEFGSPLGESGGGISLLTTQGDRTFFVATSTPIAEASVGGAITYYTAYDSTVYGSDGTTAGTQLLFDAGAGSVQYLTAEIGRAFITVTGGGTQQLYATDGTAGGTELVTTAPTGDTFQITSDSLKTLVQVEAGTSVVQRLWVDGATGAVVPAADEYVWVGPVAGSWDTAANWEDTTSGANPASVPPGSNDAVTVDGLASGAVQVITGTGGSAYLTLGAGSSYYGGTLLDGQFSTGNLALDNGGTLYLDAGDSLAVADDAVVGPAGEQTINISGGQLTVGGLLTLGNDEGYLSVADGGLVQAAALTVPDYYSSVFVDATSALEVGTAGGAAIGSVTIDAGATLTLASSYGYLSAPTIVDNGILSVDATGVSITNNAVYPPATTITGTGQIDIASNASLSLANARPGSGLTIAYTGTDGILSIAAASLDSSKIFDPTIVGFGSSDVIDYSGTVTSAAYAGDTLTLLDGTTTVAQLTLIRNYTGETFLTAWIGSGETQISLYNSAGNSPPMTSVPTQVITHPDVIQAVQGITITNNNPANVNGTFTAVLADASGLLSADSDVANGGGTIIGAGTKTLSVEGSLSQVNADLTTLSFASNTIGSDDIAVSTNDGLGGIANTFIPVTVDNYAAAGLAASGGGTFAADGTNSQGGANYTLDLGTLTQGSSAPTIDLSALNAAANPADLLTGSFSESGSSAFSNALTSFSDLTAGGGDPAGTVSLSTAATGMFSETVTLAGTGSNASGYDAFVPDATLTIEGTVQPSVTPVSDQVFDLTTGPDSFVEPAGSRDNTVIATGGTLSAGDDINPGNGGTNTLELQGTGVFNFTLPATLADIGTVTAQEGQASYVHNGVTYAGQTQIVDLRSGLDATIDVAPATVNPDNPNAPTITIVGAANDSSTIDLATGKDAVTLGSAQETVNGGGGNNTFYVNTATIGATINGGSGTNLLEITGGGTMAMGGNIKQIADALLIGSSTPYDFTANALSGLLVDDLGTTTADALVAGGSNQILTGGGAGKLTMDAANQTDALFKDSAAAFNGDALKDLVNGDMIDITGLGFSAANTSLGFAFNGGADTTTMSVLLSGTQKSAMTLLGQYMAADFTVAADTAGTGTQITLNHELNLAMPH